MLNNHLPVCVYNSFEVTNTLSEQKKCYFQENPQHHSVNSLPHFSCKRNPEEKGRR